MKTNKGLLKTASVVVLLATLLLLDSILSAARAQNGSIIFFTEHTVDDNFNGAYSVNATVLDDDGDVDVLRAASGTDDITWWEQVLNISWYTYLPLVIKDYSPPPPTPTDTPPPPSECPRVGHWQGKSYQTSPVFRTDVSLSVSNTPECRVESTEFMVYCPDIYLTKDTFGPESIINNHFEADTAQFTINIVGDFTSEIEVSGTWFDSERCQGTWEASFTSP